MFMPLSLRKLGPSFGFAIDDSKGYFPMAYLKPFYAGKHIPMPSIEDFGYSSLDAVNQQRLR